VEGLAINGLEIRNIPLATGRFFDEVENRARHRVAVIGPTVVETLFGQVDPVGQRIQVGRVPFEVIGVLAPRGSSSYGSDQDDIILVPLETAMRRLLNITYLHTIYIQARNGNAMDQAEREVRDLLEERHRRRRRSNTFTIQNQAELIETQREMTRSLTLLIGSVASIALVVGGVGILAVMLMGVRERIPEIGLRRAIGARRRDITVQFLCEAVLLATGGGLLGASAGIGASYSAARFGDWQTVLSWPSVAIGLIFSISIGIAAGIYPALRAAKLEPIQALRGE